MKTPKMKINIRFYLSKTKAIIMQRHDAYV
jgi:hypothetical protein